MFLYEQGKLLLPWEINKNITRKKPGTEQIKSKALLRFVQVWT